MQSTEVISMRSLTFVCWVGRAGENWMTLALSWPNGTATITFAAVYAPVTQSDEGVGRENDAGRPTIPANGYKLRIHT